MPLPILLWGAAAALAATGVAKGIGAMSDFESAKDIGESAARNYENAQNELDEVRKKVNISLEKLGGLKLSIFQNQIKHLVDTIKKSKNASSKLKDFNVVITTDELKEMEQLVLNSLEFERGLGKGAVTGALAAWGAYGGVGMLASASTGTAIAGLSGAAATNATLAWLGGGALSAGGFGIAGGTLALGGIVLGPALAVGGFMLASKAEEALTRAEKYKADTDVAIAKMEQTKVLLIGLQENAKQLGSVLRKTAKIYEDAKVNDDENLEAFEKMMAIGKGLKNLLDIPAMRSDGAPTENVKLKITGAVQI